MTQTFDVTLHTRAASFTAQASFETTAAKSSYTTPTAIGTAWFSAAADFTASARQGVSGSAAFGAAAKFAAYAGESFDLRLFVPASGTEQQWDAELITNARARAASFGAVANFDAVATATDYTWYEVICEIDPGDASFRARAGFIALCRKHVTGTPAFSAIADAHLTDQYEQDTGYWKERHDAHATWTERTDSAATWSER